MIIAVDTGGTKTLITSFDEAGEMSQLAKFPTPRDQNEYLEAVVAAINQSIATMDIDGIVVAVPGPIHNHILRRAPNIGWLEFDIIAALRKHFPEVPIGLENDAALAGIAEARALENKTESLCLYVTLSTGVGTGLTYGGKKITGISRFEGGSIRLQYEGALTRWENIASGQSFYERYGQFGSEVTDEKKWRDYAARIAEGFAVLIPLLEPKHIVIGGSMGTHFEKYIAFLEDILRIEIPKHMIDVEITKAKHPEEAVVYGCYYYAIDTLIG